MLVFAVAYTGRLPVYAVYPGRKMCSTLQKGKEGCVQGDVMICDSLDRSRCRGARGGLGGGGSSKQITGNSSVHVLALKRGTYTPYFLASLLGSKVSHLNNHIHIT